MQEFPRVDFEKIFVIHQASCYNREMNGRGSLVISPRPSWQAWACLEVHPHLQVDRSFVRKSAFIREPVPSPRFARPSSRKESAHAETLVQRARLCLRSSHAHAANEHGSDPKGPGRPPAYLAASDGGLGSGQQLSQG